jgi:heme-degrading monooxygenase HmoA
MGAPVYVRFFSSAVDPTDVDEVQRIFAEDIKPAFEGMPGCSSIELILCREANVGGLVDGAAVSRWSSLKELDAGIESRAASESLVRLLPLLRLEPVTRTYEVIA